jgi:hypothetical protein
MKKTIAFILLFSIKPLIGQNYYGPSYSFTQDILKELETHKQNDVASWKLSFIGEYSKAIEIWDKDKMESTSLSREGIEYFKLFKPINAKTYIKERAKNEKIIILNEAHQQPYHRVFTTSILKDLYEQGYRYFGAEALSPDDSILNDRKYPILSSGYLTYEPYCGNMIREAIRIGYKVFNYEHVSTENEKNEEGINKREIGQALNIKKIIDKDSNAKILLHCGFDHLIEDDYPHWGKAMAGRLIEYTGINPFTIDQVRLTEHSNSKFESPYFTSLKLDDYFLFIDSNGNLFNGSKGSKGFDANLYHPRTKFVYGRPHWVFENQRKPYIMNKDSLEFPCLVFAYLANENLIVTRKEFEPSPYDVIELKSKEDMKALSLKKGKFVIKIRNLKGEETIQNITVE